MKMRMFATLDKARPHTENIRGLKLAAVTCTETTLDYIDKRLTKDRPDLSSKRAPPNDRTVTFKKKKISGQKSQIGLDTKTY
jgi:hypothetical protein